MLDPDVTQPDDTQSGGEPTSERTEHVAVVLDRLRAGAQPAKPWLAWTIRVLAVAGLGLALFLSWLKITGQTAPGCGPGNVGCSAVLSSTWSQWFTVPVSLLAGAVYGAVLVASAFIGSAGNPALRRGAWNVLVACAVAITGAAIWFILIQLIQIKALCAYCMTEHTIGIVLSMLILAGAEAGRTVVRSMVVGAVGVAVLIAGQSIYTPKQMQRFQVEALGLELNLDAWPVLGERSADHVIISMFDYACPHCRKMHEYLTEARRRYGEQFAIVLMPLPQNSACNGTVGYTEENFKDSCELAKLAAAVHIAQPGALEAFDAWMFASDRPRTAAEARAEAESLVGQAELERALQSGGPEGMIKASVDIHRKTLAFPPEAIPGVSAVGSIHPFDRVPKLIVGKAVFVSRPASAEELFEGLEQELQIAPVQ